MELQTAILLALCAAGLLLAARVSGKPSTHSPASTSPSAVETELDAAARSWLSTPPIPLFGFISKAQLAARLSALAKSKPPLTPMCAASCYISQSIDSFDMYVQVYCSHCGKRALYPRGGPAEAVETCRRLVTTMRLLETGLDASLDSREFCPDCNPAWASVAKRLTEIELARMRALFKRVDDSWLRMDRAPDSAAARALRADLKAYGLESRDMWSAKQRLQQMIADAQPTLLFPNSVYPAPSMYLVVTFPDAPEPRRIPIDELTLRAIYALLTREDRFYGNNGEEPLRDLEPVLRQLLLPSDSTSEPVQPSDR